MPEDPRVAVEISRLPEAAAMISAATADAARSLIEESAGALDPAWGLPLFVPAIRAVRADVRLYLDVDGERVVFFFWREKLDRVRSMTFRLQISMVPVPASPPGAPRADGGPRPGWSITLPPFVAAPSKAETAQYGPDGARPEDVVLLRIGPGGRNVLAIEKPGDGAKARAAYTIEQRRPLDKWLARPFLDLVEAARAWLSEDAPEGAPFPMMMPALAQDRTHAHQVLDSVASAHAKAKAAARSASESLPDEPWAALVPRYEPDELTATIDLKLRSSGQLAGPTDATPIRLGVRARIDPAGSGRAVIVPAGFVARGELLGAFLTAVRSVSGELLDALRMKDDEEWADFVDDSLASAAVLRDADDAAVLVLPGRSRAQRRTIVLLAKAAVDDDAQPPTVTLDEVALGYDSLSSDDKALDADAVAPFLRWIASMKSTIALFPRRP